MRKAMMVGMMVLASLGVRLGQGAGKTAYQLANHELMFRAKALATYAFAGIGVRLRRDVGNPRLALGDSKAGCPLRPDAEIVIRPTTKRRADGPSKKQAAVAHRAKRIAAKAQ